MKQLFYSNKFRNINNDPNKTWKVINGLLGRRDRRGLTGLSDENGLYIEGLPMVNKFNNYFVNIASDLVRDLPNHNDLSNFGNFNNVVSSCYFFPTDNIEISDILRSLPNKGNKIFDITPKLLLLVNDIVLPLLCYLFNFCINTGVYPDILKIARVVPVHKDGSPGHMNNYRPISNLITLNKVFEIIIHRRMNGFITKNNILSPIQFGFRKAKNTSLAILTLFKEFLTAFNKKHYCIALFLDLRKAFDIVDRNILVNKLSRYGFRGSVSDLIRSYLSNRKQYVSLNNFNSEMLVTTHGVPQGLVLGRVATKKTLENLRNLRFYNVCFYGRIT